MFITRKSILLGCIILSISNALAQVVPSRVADQVAATFLGKNLSLSHGVARQSVQQETNSPEVHIINFLDGGWVIVSGDYCTKPILAYAHEGQFEMYDEMGNINYFIEWYSSTIDTMRASTQNVMHPEWQSYLSNYTISPHTEVIAPLLVRNGEMVNWKQSRNANGTSDYDKSYNKFCPSGDGCEHTIVGCVAVAFSQVLWYWQWPKAAYVKDDAGNVVYRQYDWTKMPAKLYDTTPIECVDQVANLLHDVGVAMYMSYGCSASSSSTSYGRTILPGVFGYDRSVIHYTNRGTTHDSVWYPMLKNELLNARPVVYRGSRNPGGHSFVIDGYDDCDYFHINYGWGGSSNGYYSLSLTGGEGATVYYHSQGCAYGIQPIEHCSPIHIDINNEIHDKDIFQTADSIIISDVVINSPIRAAFISGKEIVLQEGISIEQGAEVILNGSSFPSCRE